MIVLITGASSGFGEAMAREFVRHGHQTIAAARRAERLARLQHELGPCMRNMKAVLAAAGMTMEDLIMGTVYTAGMQEFALLNRIYSCYFEPLAVYPSRAVLGISALPNAARVELTAIAKK